MAAGLEGQRIALNENDIYGAKLIKEIDLLTKTETIRWLKCRSCRNLSDLTLKELKNKIQVFITYGWDKTLLVDSEGKVSEQRRHEVQSKFKKLAQSLLDGEGIPRGQLDDVPALTHEVVEDFFRQTYDKRHVAEGYAFSKTKRIDTSGKNNKT